jgi:hypothetical protein
MRVELGRSHALVLDSDIREAFIHFLGCVTSNLKLQFKVNLNL